MKRDKYLRVRCGFAHMIDISCVSCGALILHYQKDGPGGLLRCYLNRIVAPEKLEKMQRDSAVRETSDMPNLICDCGEVIGYPMKHKDGRLAYRLERGKSKRKRIK